MTHQSRRRGRSGVAGIRHHTAGRLPDHAGNGARTFGRCRHGAPHARGTDARRQPRQPARSRESRRRPCQCESPAPGAGQLRLARPQFVQWSVASHHHPPFLAAGTRPAPGMRLLLRAPGDPFAGPRMLVRLRSGADKGSLQAGPPGEVLGRVETPSALESVGLPSVIPARAPGNA